MSDANKALVRRLYEQLNAGDLNVIDELVSDDFVEHEEFPGLEPNKTGLRKMFELFHTAFQYSKFEVDDVIGEGDRVSVRARMTGTHRAEFMGIPGAGQTINVGVGDYFRIADGMVAEHWGVMDTGAMMQQLTAD